MALALNVPFARRGGRDGYVMTFVRVGLTW